MQAYLHGEETQIMGERGLSQKASDDGGLREGRRTACADADQETDEREATQGTKSLQPDALCGAGIVEHPFRGHLAFGFPHRFYDFNHCPGPPGAHSTRCAPRPQGLVGFNKHAQRVLRAPSGGIILMPL